MQPTIMTPNERRASLALALVMTLRMLGLFMILPLFTLYAQGLPGATPTLIGIALGIYGLAQALLQAPFGLLSDRFGRKPIITLGLFIFILGSLVSAAAHNMTLLILGRILQGSGAVGSVILALAADLTRLEQRTKTMALMGISIGFSFLLAMLLGPILNTWFSVAQIFILCAFFGLLAIAVLYLTVPDPSTSPVKVQSLPWQQLRKILTQPALMQLDIGIFTLHAVLTANFIVIPINLMQTFHFAANQQWRIFVPTLCLSIFAMLPFIRLAEQPSRLPKLLKLAIAGLVLSEITLLLGSQSLIVTALGLVVFFTAFNVLEAYLPSMVSKLAPITNRGAAIGMFSSCQFLGIFFGGSIGGWLYQHYNMPGVFIAAILATTLWLILTIASFANMQETA